MTLNETIELMLSGDYKDRFKAEYYQTKIRHEKLHKICIKFEAGTLDFESDCPYELLLEQEEHMEQYLHDLELRAELEGVDIWNDEEQTTFSDASSENLVESGDIDYADANNETAE